MYSMRNSLTVGLVAFVAYCVYFDRKRRSAPDFKAKLKESKHCFKNCIFFPKTVFSRTFKSQTIKGKFNGI